MLALMRLIKGRVKMLRAILEDAIEILCLAAFVLAIYVFAVSI